MNSKSKIIPVELNNGKIIHVEATDLGGGQDISVGSLLFEDAVDAIHEISKSILNKIELMKPKKAIVEFGLEVALESGKLTAVLVKGNSKASIKITFEWLDSSNV